MSSLALQTAAKKVFLLDQGFREGEVLVDVLLIHPQERAPDVDSILHSPPQLSVQMIFRWALAAANVDFRLHWPPQMSIQITLCCSGGWLRRPDFMLLSPPQMSMHAPPFCPPHMSRQTLPRKVDARLPFRRRGHHVLGGTHAPEAENAVTLHREKPGQCAPLLYSRYRSFA